MKGLPLARNEGVVVQEMDEEILVYDLVENKAFCLNQTASRVYRACGEKSSFEALKLEYEFTDEIIFLALDELKKTNLVEVNSLYVSPFAGASRREAIKRVGLASMIALPVISSLVAPTAIHAQSLAAGCVQPGQLPGTSQSYPGLTGGVSCNCQSCLPTCPVCCVQVFNNCNPKCCSGMAVDALDNGLMTLCFC